MLSETFRMALNYSWEVKFFQSVIVINEILQDSVFAEFRRNWSRLWSRRARKIWLVSAIMPASRTLGSVYYSRRDRYRLACDHVRFLPTPCEVQGGTDYTSRKSIKFCLHVNVFVSLDNHATSRMEAANFKIHGHIKDFQICRLHPARSIIARESKT